MIATITENPKPRGCGYTFNIETVALVITVIKCIFFSFVSFIFIIGTIILLNEDRRLAALALMVTVAALSIAGYSLVLTRGLLRKDAELLKIYFAYGMTGSIFMAAISIALAIYPGDIYLNNYKAIVDTYNLVIVYSIIAYTAVLYMVRATYLKFEARATNRSRYEDNLLLLDSNKKSVLY